jgi:hypothetical protein
MPCFDEEVGVLAGILCRETLTSYERAFITDESFKFATIACIKTSFPAFVTAFELALTFSVLGQLARGRSCQLWCRYARGRLDEA